MADQQTAPEDELETDESYPAPSIGERLRRLSPASVLLPVASVLSLGVLAWGLLSRSTSVPLLVSSALVTGIVFLLDTFALWVATLRAGRAGELGHAVLMALLGGATSMASALSFAGALILVLLLNP
jgi:hypothetical protein